MTPVLNVLSTVCSLTLQLSHAMRLPSHLFDCHANNIIYLLMRTQETVFYLFSWRLVVAHSNLSTTVQGRHATITT